MWLMIHHAIHDLHQSNWTIKLFWAGLVLLSSFLLGSLGGLGIQTMKAKLWTTSAPMPPSGSASAPLTIPSLSSVPNTTTSDKTWTIKKLESEPSNIEAKDGK